MSTTRIDECEMEFYRSTAAGIALTKSLNEMITAKDITTEIAIEILNKFDSVFAKKLKEHIINNRLKNIELFVRFTSVF